MNIRLAERLSRYPNKILPLSIEFHCFCKIGLRSYSIQEDFCKAIAVPDFLLTETSFSRAVCIQAMRRSSRTGHYQSSFRQFPWSDVRSMYSNGSRNEKTYIVIIDQSDRPLLKGCVVSPPWRERQAPSPFSYDWPWPSPQLCG